MPEFVLLVVAAGTATFVLGGFYYAILGERLAAAGGTTTTMKPWMFAAEAGRCLVLAAVVSGLAIHLQAGGWIGGLTLGLALWLGFPVVLWVGAIVHESTSG
ncbi:hypothetical protein [Acrocarpospora catenulata]|uniref:hypothetical protein n=1 Tax=Acrocarpospora catenulata TaxID=2836182 RepID=UPI001BD9E63C|nr:hypothetical protein [Acrocarpospora catenulata]